MVDEMLEGLAADRHTQRGEVGEVGLTEIAGLVHLREEHFARGSLQSTPGLDPALQCPELAVPGSGPDRSAGDG